MPMTVKISVGLGNDAMLSWEDVRDALERDLPDPSAGSCTVGSRGLVVDWNGNVVGDWEVVET